MATNERSCSSSREKSRLDVPISCILTSQKPRRGVGPDSCHVRGSARGQVLMLAAMAMVVIIGFVALATDVGLLWSKRRQMQTAADAAAVAGVMAMRNSASITSAANTVATL